MKHKKEKYEIDCKLVDTYEKIIIMQMNRIVWIVKKLQNLADRNDTDNECPEEYGTKSYTQWTKNDLKLNTLQSEILELLGKKIRYRSFFDIK